jgi:hypothetical protein
MRDDEFQKAMDRWAESEMASAPDLHPTAEMVRLVRAKQEPRRAFPIPSRWAVAGAAIAALMLVAALFAIILRSGLIPGWSPPAEGTLIAQREGPGEVQVAIVRGGDKGPGEKGPVRGQPSFRQLLLAYQPQGAPTAQAIDLLNPPEEILVLTPADNYRLVMEAVEERNVYVYQLTSSGSLVQLFPNPAYSTATNPFLAGQPTMVPAEPNWLYLDGVAGEERLYVVAAPQPLQDLDDLYAEYSRGPDAAGRREILPDLLDMLETIAETHPGGAVVVEFAFQHR